MTASTIIPIDPFNKYEIFCWLQENCTAAFELESNEIHFADAKDATFFRLAYDD